MDLIDYKNLKKNLVTIRVYSEAFVKGSGRLKFHLASCVDLNQLCLSLSR
jgi:hypothetical protein